MNYADLFRATLPETALEVAALVVLVVDLGFLRKAAKDAHRRCRAGGRRGLRRGAVGGFACAGPYSAGNDLLLAAGGSAGVAQAASSF